ncbi:Zinc Finger Swim Domain-Containing Protein 3 [Manis pentadactyla]|nr:Zinc Finger Swim Domain-Containing Protein 3 [Manis pentadactyla]
MGAVKKYQNTLLRCSREEFCPDSAAVGSKQDFSWLSPGKVAKLLFTCKNMLFIFQSLLVNLEIADSPAQEENLWFDRSPSAEVDSP